MLLPFFSSFFRFFLSWLSSSLRISTGLSLHGSFPDEFGEEEISRLVLGVRMGSLDRVKFVISW